MQTQTQIQNSNSSSSSNLAALEESKKSYEL